MNPSKSEALLWVQSLGCTKPLLALADKLKLELWFEMGSVLDGWAQVRRGNEAEGLSRLRGALDHLLTSGAGFHRSFHYGLLADSLLCLGDADQALEGADEGLDFASRTGEGFWLPELHRLKGCAFLALGRSTDAEACFEAAISSARSTGSRMLELRATESLCRIWRDQGKLVESRESLNTILEWFAAGVATPDLITARTLISEIEMTLATQGEIPPASTPPRA